MKNKPFTSDDLALLCQFNASDPHSPRTKLIRRLIREYTELLREKLMREGILASVGGKVVLLPGR